MVTIKIQSSEDVVKAFLCNLGFNADLSAENSLKVLEMIDNDLSSGDEVIAKLDKLLLTSAQRIWPETNYTPEQLTALIKIAFILNDGPNRWGTQIFKSEKLPKDLIQIIYNYSLCQAPHYAFAKMEPQKIEPVVSQNLFSKLFHLSFKKD